MACGDYGAQEIGFDPSKATSTSYVTFEPAASGVCWNQTAGISIGAQGVRGPSYLVLQGVNYGGGITVHQQPRDAASVVDLATSVIDSDHVVIDNQSGGRFDMISARNFLVADSDIGNCTAVYYGIPGAGGLGNFCLPRILGGISGIRPTGSVINTKMHDIHDGGTTACITYDQCHVDGLAIFGSNGVTLDRDAFWNNDIANVRIQNSCGCRNAENHNITIENSWFGQVLNGQQTSISDDSGVDHFVVRFNSFSAAHDAAHPYPGAALVCSGGGTLYARNGGACGTRTVPAQIYGNLWVSAGACPTDTDFDYNIYISHSPYTGTRKCGATDTLYGYGGETRFPYLRDPTTGPPDFNITGRLWVGDNHVPVKQVRRYPRTDFHGIERSIWRGRLDAGAVQRRMTPHPRSRRKGKRN